ncbi:Serine/threonine protein kinase PrkC, regulator of stationary phase [hydrothermal vent metagenome]|uniref:Serine/threonine protein kinase PrkC, regulator of stationary phase n=1 Tax=hydrothermal vent metagenome TaxID=652676 RepID=A0A3B1E3I7_9ZZZZ
MHPEKIGEYLIDKKIGSGGMGTVYLAHHKLSGNKAAVKVLLATLAQEEGYVARFTREIQALQKLSNPHIVEVFESGMEEGIYFFAMEYVEGETLTMRLRRERKIPWRETIEIALQICSALKAAHDAGIIHRDLKPSNLLIAKDGTVKLTDFGVAQVFASTKLTITGGVLGTAEYMSPEQAQGQRTTKKSDLYSLGAVMYTMLTGRPPFTGKTSVEIMQKHRYGVFDSPKMYAEDIPYWLDELVCQLLEKDPEDRLPDAFVLSKKLQEILKKVELSNEGKTQKLDVYDADAPTIDAVASGEGNGFRLAENRGPGAATFMRDLVRTEVSRQNNPGPFLNFFNNTWVLLLLLAMVIGGGFLFFRNPEKTPRQKFNAGVILMKQPANKEWLRAREEFFLPLSQKEDWHEKVAPYLKKIELYELKKGSQPFFNSGKKTFNEPKRLLSLAMGYEQRGETKQAIKMLESIIVLTKDQSEHQTIFQLATEQLAALKEENNLTQEQKKFLQSVCHRATQLEKEGKTKEAKAIWKTLNDLYKEKPAAKKFILQAKEGLGD